ncbi:hypothetical protein N9L47_12385 [Rhodobacteraceae bacterium]|nr:hypothetical protein [Paracoccaceae bacterium]
MKRTLALIAATAILTTPVLAASDVIVTEVDVKFDLTAIDDQQASEFWSSLEDDLETAIIARLGDQIGPRGKTIEVDIEELAISSAFQGALGVDSALIGNISISDPYNIGGKNEYELRVRLDESGRFETTEDGTQIVTHEREKVYNGVVDTFAATVVERLE